MFVIHYYLQLARKPTNKKVVTKNSCGKADKIVLYNMAVLSQRLGFDSISVTDLLKYTSDWQIVYKTLLKIYKLGSYQYNTDIFESLIDWVVECFISAVVYSTHLVSNVVLYRVSRLCFCCGPLYQDIYLLDWLLLFLDCIYTKSLLTSDIVSLFYIRQYIYFAFFGKPSTDSREQLDNIDNLQSPLFVPIDKYTKISI